METNMQQYYLERARVRRKNMLMMPVIIFALITVGFIAGYFFALKQCEQLINKKHGTTEQQYRRPYSNR